MDRGETTLGDPESLGDGAGRPLGPFGWSLFGGQRAAMAARVLVICAGLCSSGINAHSVTQYQVRTYASFCFEKILQKLSGRWMR